MNDRIRKFIFEPLATAIPVVTEQEEIQHINIATETVANDESELLSPEYVETLVASRIEAAEQAAYQKALHSFHSQKEREIELQQSTLETKQHIIEALDKLSSNPVLISEDTLNELVKIVVNFGKKLSQKLVEHYPEHTIFQMLTTLLPKLMHEPEITLEIHPDQKNTFEPLITEWINESKFKGKIILNENHSIPYTDCKCYWSQGIANYDHEAIMQKMEDLAKEYFICSKTTSPNVIVDILQNE